MPEQSVDLEYAGEQIRIHEELKRVPERDEIVFVPGLEEYVGYFPLLDSIPGKPVLARFGYGFNMPNMSGVFFDSSKGESEVTGERNTRLFLESQKFDADRSIQVLGKFQGNEAQIEEVSLDTLRDKKKAAGNVIFTRDPRITLDIKMADCPTAVFYATDREGRPVTGIIHGGAEAAMYGLIRQGIQAMQLELGVDPKSMKIGVFPGMKDYTLSRFWRDHNGHIKRRYDGFYPANINGFLEPAKTEDPLEMRKIDLTSVFELQALQAGVQPENMDVYRMDTYADAARKRIYSRRYSNDHNGEHPGGNILAVKLVEQPQFTYGQAK